MLKQAYKLTVPYLLCYGLKDFLQDPKENEKHFTNINSRDKQAEIFPEGYHQLHKDYEADDLFMRIALWMEARRGKIKWKSVKALEKGNYLNWDNFWQKLLLLIGALIGLIKLIRKLKGYLMLAY